MKLNEKQKRFITEYIKEHNATQSAIRAGYSKKTAYSQGQRLLKHVEIKKEIEQLLGEIRNKNIADTEEIEEFFTNSMRGEIKEEVVVTEGTGDGTSEAKIIKKQISAKDRLKAAELLGKRYSLFTEKLNVSEAIPVVIVGEDDLDE